MTPFSPIAIVPFATSNLPEITEKPRYQDRCFPFRGSISVSLSGEYSFQDSVSIRNHAKISHISIFGGRTRSRSQKVSIEELTFSTCRLSLRRCEKEDRAQKRRDEKEAITSDSLMFHLLAAENRERAIEYLE